MAIGVVGLALTATASVFATSRAFAVSPGSCGSVLLSGSSWLGGSGVSVMSNGSDEGTGASCGGTSTVGGVVAGSEWQCTELINRLYLSKGWISSTWHGNGGDSSSGAHDSLYDEAPSGLSKSPNGSISSVAPGDVVSINEYYNGSFLADGHALIVNTSAQVSSGTVPLVSQNSGSPTDATPQRTATLTNGVLTINGAGGGYTYSVIGVVHAPTSITSDLPKNSAIASLGRDGTVWYTEPGVQGWTSTGAGFFATGSPSIAALPDGNVVIAALGRNEDNIWYTIPGVQGWTSTGSSFVGSSDPSVAVAPSGTITIAVRGTDNTVWYYEPGVQGWTSTGGGFFGAGSPSIAETPDGHPVIASLGANAYNIWYTMPGVQGWTSTGSAFVGSSDAVVGVNASGTICIVVRGTDSTIWFDESGVQSWTSTGGGFFGGGNPAVDGGSQPPGPDEGPAITSANSAQFTAKNPGSFDVISSGSPPPSLSESGKLPSGVTFKDHGDGSGTLSGTPSAGTVGSYSITIEAGNGFPNAVTQNFILRIAGLTTHTRVSVYPKSVRHGFKVSYLAVVSSSFGTPTGSITFSIGTQKMCTATVKMGKASCSSTKAPIGTDGVKGVYKATSTYAESSGSATLKVR
jgi:hypothetical protein